MSGAWILLAFVFGYALAPVLLLPLMLFVPKRAGVGSYQSPKCCPYFTNGKCARGVPCACRIDGGI